MLIGVMFYVLWFLWQIFFLVESLVVQNRTNGAVQSNVLHLKCMSWGFEVSSHFARQNLIVFCSHKAL